MAKKTTFTLAERNLVFRTETHVIWFMWSVVHPLHPRRFYRNTGMEGWKGDGEGTKVMVFEADMPHCGTEGFSECTHNRPAVWALNDKVSETYLFRSPSYCPAIYN